MTFFKYMNLLFQPRLMQATNNSTDNGGDGGGGKSDTQDFHCSLMTGLWVVFINLAVLAIIFKFTKYTFWIHAFLTSIILVLSFIGCIILLVPNGIQIDSLSEGGQALDNIHHVVGLIFTIWIFAQAVTGILARKIQQIQNIQPRKVIITKRIHRYFSYAMLLMGTFNVVNKNYQDDPASFWFLLILQIVCIALYIALKNFYPSLSSKMTDSQIISKQKVEIFQINGQSKINELIKQKNQYVIFSDYVYDLSPLKGQHPGGQLVINLMKKRQIDRFLYGMYFAQTITNVNPISHSMHSMRLVGPPVAKIKRDFVVEGMDQINPFQIDRISELSFESCSYILELVPVSTSLYFKGYKSLDQFGQYFALNLNQSVTRLYTTVFCIRKQNMYFMQQNFKGSTKSIKGNLLMEQQMQMAGLSTFNPVNAFCRSSGDKFNEQTIPLLIKKYDAGLMTPILLNQELKTKNMITLSCPKGSGMRFQQAKSGQIVMVAGGTGLFPFLDFIDILFKKTLTQQLHILTQLIISKDPVIKLDFTDNKSFFLMLAVNSPVDIPSMSLYQINYLCKSKYINFKCHFKARNDLQIVKSIYPNIKIVSKRFHNTIMEELSKDISKIYICGPPEMNADFGKLFQDQNISEQLYQYM